MQTDRRTRDRIRLFFWALLTVVCLVAALVADRARRLADPALGISYTRSDGSSAGLTLAANLAPDSGTISGDRKRLNQALDHLLRDVALQAALQQVNDGVVSLFPVSGAGRQNRFWKSVNIGSEFFPCQMTSRSGA